MFLLTSRDPPISQLLETSPWTVLCLPTGPALSISLSDSQPPLGRPLGKIKRFLSTLVQFGQDISPETGERVKSLVINLVVSHLSDNAMSSVSLVWNLTTLSQGDGTTVASPSNKRHTSIVFPLAYRFTTKATTALIHCSFLYDCLGHRTLRRRVPPLSPGSNQLPAEALRAALPEGLPAGPSAGTGRTRQTIQTGIVGYCRMISDLMDE